MRLKGDTKGSEHVIATFLSSLNILLSDLVHEDLAALYLSQATNHAYYFSFAVAYGEVKKWKPVQYLPGRQEYLLWDQILYIGRIMRGEGYFMEAKTCFEACLSAPGLRDSKRFLVKSALADLYCELAYFDIGKRTFYLS